MGRRKVHQLPQERLQLAQLEEQRQQRLQE
jgi:hypothetical protein